MELHHPVHYIALLLNELILAVIIWIWLRWTGSQRTLLKKLVRAVGGLLLLTICGYALRTQLMRLDVPFITWNPNRLAHSPAVGLTCLLLCLTCYWAGIRHSAKIIGAALRNLLLVFSPLAAATTVAAIWMMVRPDVSDWKQPPLAELVNNGGRQTNRVMLIVFDEWDPSLTFKNKDHLLSLGEFDSFRKKSLYATQAMQGGSRTLVSVPSITTGQKVQSALAKGPNDFLLSTSMGIRKWQEMNHVFRDARNLGINVAIVGWYIPYCRLFAASCTACSSWPYIGSSFPVIANFWEVFTAQRHFILETDQFSPWGQTLMQRTNVTMYSQFLEAAKLAAGNQSHGFLYIHMPVPHGPQYYERSLQTFTAMNRTADGYLSALALADKTLGEIRKSMQQAGTWDKTTIILTADHPLRFKSLGGNGEKRVPLLIRMPGQHNQIVLNHPIEATILKDVVLTLLQGRLKDPPDLQRYIEQTSKVAIATN